MGNSLFRKQSAAFQMGPSDDVYFRFNIFYSRVVFMMHLLQHSVRLAVTCILLLGMASAAAQRPLSDEEIAKTLAGFDEYRSSFDYENVTLELRFKVLGDYLGKRITDVDKAGEFTFTESIAIADNRVRSSTYIPILGGDSSGAKTVYCRCERLTVYDSDKIHTTDLGYDVDGKPDQVSYYCQSLGLPRQGTSGAFRILTGMLELEAPDHVRDPRGTFRDSFNKASKVYSEPDGTAGNLITFVCNVSERVRWIYTLRDRPSVHCVKEVKQDLRTGDQYVRKTEYGERQGRFVPVQWSETATLARKDDRGNPTVKVRQATECELVDVQFLDEDNPELFKLDIPEGINGVNECGN